MPLTLNVSKTSFKNVNIQEARKTRLKMLVKKLYLTLLLQYKFTSKMSSLDVKITQNTDLNSDSNTLNFNDTHFFLNTTLRTKAIQLVLGDNNNLSQP